MGIREKITIQKVAVTITPKHVVHFDINKSNQVCTTLRAGCSDVGNMTRILSISRELLFAEAAVKTS